MITVAKTVRKYPAFGAKISVVGVATKVWATIFFSYPNRPDRLCGATCIPFSELQGFLSG
jgi:hypothetical protein